MRQVLEPAIAALLVEVGSSLVRSRIYSAALAGLSRVSQPVTPVPHRRNREGMGIGTIARAELYFRFRLSIVISTAPDNFSNC